MTQKLINEDSPEINNGINLGPRLVRDVQRRIHEIEARWPAARTRQDWHELGRLRQLLQLLRTGGRAND
jgi:hypothetical protein